MGNKWKLARKYKSGRRESFDAQTRRMKRYRANHRKHW